MRVSSVASSIQFFRTVAVLISPRNSSQIVVGAVVGKWLLGPAGDTWALIARMALGLTLLKVVGTVPFFGDLVRLAVLLWGLGAISLVLYRQFESVRPAGVAPTAA